MDAVPGARSTLTRCLPDSLDADRTAWMPAGLPRCRRAASMPAGLRSEEISWRLSIGAGLVRVGSEEPTRCRPPQEQE